MKKKIKLDLDQLSVETFETVAGNRGREGTVYGHATEWTLCDPPCTGESCDHSCGSCVTCDPRMRTCNAMTCDGSCHACTAAC